MKQKTIQKDCVISGVGLHTGNKVTITIKPSAVNQGIYFKRIDLTDQPIIKADISNINFDESTRRCTTLSFKDIKINTIEHLMSALSGLRITNVCIEIDSDELPGLDGSAQGFLDAIQKAGVAEQDAEALSYKIKETIGVQEGDASLFAAPCDDLRISYALSYPHPLLQSQFFSTTVTQDVFKNEIASCRTFCLEEEAIALREQGFGKGAGYQNTLVMGKSGPIENTLHFNNECARHKALDFLGDIYLLGMPIQASIFGVKSGHNLNLKLLKKIVEQKERYERKGIIEFLDIKGKKELNVNDIMKVLPHRYPFLFVDRYFEVEPGKKGVGIKNVTANDNFFTGHFPTKPIMPGVLMVEAMAQVGGITVLTGGNHRGKVALFMAVNNVKFRKVVVPGDQLVMEAEVVRDKSRIAQIIGISKVNGEVVAEANMTFSFTDAGFLNKIS